MRVKSLFTCFLNNKQHETPMTEIKKSGHTRR